METLDFKYQNWVVDYISFKFQKLNNITKKQIPNSLFKIKWNVYQQSGKLAKLIQ